MRFLDRLLRRTDPERLLERLLDAAARSDRSPLIELCRANERTIAEKFASWCRFPPDVRDDPEKCRRRGEGLIAIARAFDEHLGRPALLASLLPPRGEDPFERLERSLLITRRLVDAGRWYEAFASLQDLLDEVSRLRGTGAEHYRALALGQLGEARFRVGDLEGAREAFQGALAACERVRDEEGIRIYRKNIAVTRRALGR